MNIKIFARKTRSACILAINYLDRALFARYRVDQGRLVPEEIALDISGACNAQCFFCSRQYLPEDKSKWFMELDLAFKLLAEAKELKLKRLALHSTGEPLMHPKFDKILQKALDTGIPIHLFTNASLLHKHFDLVAQIPSVNFSIEGWTAEAYEIYRKPLKFDRVFANLQKFHSLP